MTWSPRSTLHRELDAIVVEVEAAVRVLQQITIEGIDATGLASPVPTFCSSITPLQPAAP